jgi:GTP cyclohydrolase I
MPYSLDIRKAKVGYLGYVIDIIGLSNISNAIDIYKDRTL